MPKAKKRLRTKILVGNDINGDPVYKWASGYTKKELEANKEELHRSFIGGSAVERDVLFSTFVLRWFQVAKDGAASRRTGRKLSASAINNTRTAINTYLLPDLGDRQMRAITYYDLQATVDKLAGKSDTLIGDVLAVIKEIFPMAYASGVIDRDPSVAIKKPYALQESSRRALTEEETTAVLRLIEERREGWELLALLYYTGARRGEVLALTWADLDFDARQIDVNKDVDYIMGKLGEVKTPTSMRKIPMPEELAALLLPVRGEPSAYVVKSPRGPGFMGTATYTRRWKQIQMDLLEVAPSIESKEINHPPKGMGHRSDLEDAVPIFGSVLTAHYFRHNYCSILYDAGVDVLTAQKVLGHSDPTTTMRIYAHLSKNREAISTEALLGAFKKSQGNGQK